MCIRDRSAVDRERARSVVLLDASNAAESAARHVARSVDEVGFDPNDVIFDPNILAIGTGIEEHADLSLIHI